MIKKVLLICLFAALLPLALFGAKNVDKEEDVEELTKADVLATCAGFDKAIADGEKMSSIKSPVYKMFADTINDWLKNYRFLEVDTEIDRSWYERTGKMLEYIYECRKFIELAQMANKVKSEEYEKIKNNLNEAHRRFAELVKNPTPVDKDKLNKLRDEKAKWQAQKRREQP